MPNSGRNEIQDEVDKYCDGDFQRFERAVSHLAVTDRSQWQEPQARKVHGKKNGGMYEIRYKANNRPTRALGFFNHDDSEFIITKLCFHKGRVYKPTDSIETAKRNFQKIKDGQANKVPLNLDRENIQEDEE